LLPQAEEPEVKVSLLAKLCYFVGHEQFPATVRAQNAVTQIECGASVGFARQSDKRLQVLGRRLFLRRICELAQPMKYAIGRVRILEHRSVHSIGQSLFAPFRAQHAIGCETSPRQWSACPPIR
jgi:hypothetical protein